MRLYREDLGHAAAAVVFTLRGNYRCKLLQAIDPCGRTYSVSQKP
jgi:hypothetical protein